MSTQETNDDSSSIKGSHAEEKKKVSWSKGKPQGKFNNQNQNKKSNKFRGGTAGLEDHIFYYGKDMNQKWLKSRAKLLNYIGKKYTMSEALSIRTGERTIVGISEPTKWEKEDEFKKQPYYLQERWKLEMKRYTDACSIVDRNLSSIYALIWGQLTTTLQNKLMAEKEFKEIASNSDAPGLFSLVSKICNRSSTISHPPTSMVMSLYTLADLSGNKMELSEFYEHFHQRRETAKEVGLDVVSEKMKTYISEKRLAEVYGGNEENKEYKEWVKDVETNAEEQFYALMFLQQAGDRYEECRRDLNNDFTKGTNHMPETVDEAYAILESYDIGKKGNANNRTRGTSNGNAGNNASRGHAFHQSGQNFP